MTAQTKILLAGTNTKMKALPRLWAFIICSVTTATLACLPNLSRAESSLPVASLVTELHESAEIWALAFNPSNQELATTSPHGDEDLEDLQHLQWR